MPFDRANVREFESTAIAKLVAEGVPKHIAHAFVTLGVIKNSQQYERIRDIVCPMEMQEFFIPISDRDFKDPLRLGGTGALVPSVVLDNAQRFYTQFTMSDVESVKFSKAFPEFRIINSGKTFNQHSYYANKRYAECELLLGMVQKHARLAGGEMSARSLVDLGGNVSYHTKRDRAYVHCENPVLSGRDKARYVVREIFSGEDPSMRCGMKFQECNSSYDYAIAVHSTYDMSPKTIASTMLRRGIKGFFGVLNVIPGLQSKPAGVYEADGLVATVVRDQRKPPYASFTFRHDTAVEYSHSLAEMSQYMYTERQYDFMRKDGSVASYLYKIESVRGCALVFSITLGGSSAPLSNNIWTPRSSSQYSLTLKLLGVNDFDVDCELFDRLVLQACSARNFEQYDIVALYRYAKSLRQRVSINGVVLSSGYCMNPEQLVYVCIAAYSVAASYRVESADFFKKASTQLIKRRGGESVLRSLFLFAAGAVGSALEGLSAIFGKQTFFSAAVAKVRDMVARKFPIEVVIDKPHAGRGLPTMTHMLQEPFQPMPGGQLVRSSQHSLPFTPLAFGGLNPTLGATAVRCAGELRAFMSYGLSQYAASERPRDCKPYTYDVGVETDYPVFSEEYRALLYGTALRQAMGLQGWDYNPLVLANGDRVFRRAPVSIGEVSNTTDSADRFIGPRSQYVVFRGVGSKAVALGKPRVYTVGVCVAFVLFYEHDDAEAADNKLKHRMAKYDNSLPGYSDIAKESLHPPSTREDWEVMLGRPGVKKYATPSEARRAVNADLDQGFYTMTGALQESDTPPVSIHSTPPGTVGGAVTKYNAAVSEPGLPSAPASPSAGDRLMYDLEWGDDGSEGSPSLAMHALPDVPGEATQLAVVEGSVVSDPVERGRKSMEEFVRACDASREVSLQSSRQVIDMALAVASSDASASKWGALTQGVPGDPVIVRVRGLEWTDPVSGEPVPHMAVSDGVDVYDRITNPPKLDGIYVTSAEMLVYTGAAIRQSVLDVLHDGYTCDAVCMNGVAGSGKTYTIIHSVSDGDVILCETAAALTDTMRRLERMGTGFTAGATVDSFLMHKQFDSADVLWVDEAFRLHAAKLYACIKLLKPREVRAFGDSKQIPVLPYIPDFDFEHEKFEYTKYELCKDTRRSPADVCLALSQPKYYGFSVRTYKHKLRSLQGPVPYHSAMFLSKPEDVVLLTYTRSARDDLLKGGVKNVMTIGQAQGCTFEDVILYRDSDLNKVLYYDLEQTLVAFTRHTVSFTYVTVAFAVDNSEASALLKYVRDTQTDILLAYHCVSEDSGSESAEVRVSPEDDGLFDDDDFDDMGEYADL